MNADHGSGKSGTDSTDALIASVRDLAQTGAAPADVAARAAEILGVPASNLSELLQIVQASARNAHTGSPDVQTLLDASVPDQDRARSLRRLGFRQDARPTVLAVLGPAAGVDRVIAQLRSTTDVHHSTIDGLDVLLSTGSAAQIAELRVPTGLRGGYLASSPVHALPDAWRRARNAVRFALPARHDDTAAASDSAVLVDANQLGPYEILAEQLSVTQMARIPDVERLSDLLRAAGPDMLDTLLAVAATDSVREAARRLHMHHNTVSHRVERAQGAFDFPLTEPYGRARLLLILTLHRLVASNMLF